MITLCGHLILLTAGIENVGRYQHLQKFIFLKREHFQKNSQRQISLVVIDDKEIYWNQISTTSMIQQILFRFSSSPDRVEKIKFVQISEITYNFQKCFTDYNRGFLVQQKCVRREEVAAQLGYHFEGESWFIGKSETLNISGNMQPTLFIFFTMFFFVFNWLLSKNYWDYLVIIDQGHCKDNLLQFC